ncbi:MAG: hypothetical protein GY696_01065 [Gammaproteobacteria bacterium]|nr:hypothetical protein [Gammaproteobacteria bacterium]
MTKFILAGFPRTGTTVLAGSIIAHPELLFYGELFSNTAQVRHTEAMRITMGAGWKLESVLDWGIPPCSYTGSTHGYLDELYNCEVSFKAVGFKIMFDQAMDGPNSDVWNYIGDHPEIKIIRTKRDSRLEVICSYVRAHITRRWHTTGGPMPNPRFVIPPHEFLALLKKMETVPMPIQKVDSTHQVLELDYGRISEDFQACMSDIYLFLDLTSGEVTPPRLKKIARMKPNEELANYEELKQHFQNTKYSKYFTF